MRKEKKVKEWKRLSKVEKALILIADYMEDPMHDQYKVKNHVLDILGLEEFKRPLQEKKK